MSDNKKIVDVNYPDGGIVHYFPAEHGEKAFVTKADTDALVDQLLKANEELHRELCRVRNA